MSLLYGEEIDKVRLISVIKREKEIRKELTP